MVTTYLPPMNFGLSDLEAHGLGYAEYVQIAQLEGLRRMQHDRTIKEQFREFRPRWLEEAR